MLLELEISLYHSLSHSLTISPCSPPLRLGFLTAWQPHDYLHGGSGPQWKYPSKQGVSYITFDDLASEVPQCLPFVLITNESQAHPDSKGGDIDYIFQWKECQDYSIE